MSEQRTLYREANPEPDYVGGTLYPREAAAVQMWVVPVSVGDLSVNRARFKARVAETLLRIQVEGGQGVITVEQWPELIEAIAARFDREVVAALGVTDEA